MRPDLVFIKLLSTYKLQTRPIGTLDRFYIVFRLAVYRVVWSQFRVFRKLKILIIVSLSRYQGRVVHKHI